MPLLLVYNVGRLWLRSPNLNGADLISAAVYQYFGPVGFLLLQVALVVAAAGVVMALKHRGALSLRHFPIVLLESAVYGVLVAVVIRLVVRQVLWPLGPTGGGGTAEAIVFSAGAGFHEELVFRLLLLSAVAYVIENLLGAPRVVAGAMAVLGTAVVFALAHYVGAESFRWASFAYRAMAGGIFGALFLLRGFSVAAYTHAFYDVYVLT